MRTLLLAVPVSVILLAGCTSGPAKVGGDAGPAGRPKTSSAPPPPSSAPPAPASSAASTPAGADQGGSGSEIRRTDWANVTLRNVGFLGVGDLAFRGGKATADHINCTMLPGGAKPSFAEFITEEPANAPGTEDAVVLIECGSDAMQQALVLVQLGSDQRTRQRAGLIQAEIPPTATSRMTFTSYSVSQGQVVTTVRRPDGGTESRRYRHNGGNSWGRA